MTNRNETGDDGVLVVNSRRVPFTDLSHDINFETESSNFSDGLERDTAYVEKYAEGTIEADGSKAELKEILLDANGNPKDGIKILITASETGDRFTDVKILNFGREFPGGGKTTTTIDWEADKHRPIR